MKLLQSLNILRKNKSKENLIFHKYKILQEIGIGAFGQVYSVQNIFSKKTFAMKTELLTSQIKYLKTEADYLVLLQGYGIPKIIAYGHNNTHNILIEELLGESLDYIFIKKNINCTISDICMIGLQLLDRLKWIHSKNIIYRDIKPCNILIGKKDPNVIYLIDFGLCKKYRSSKTEKHIMPKITKFFNGTMNFASYNALKGKEQSRRDDLISLGYVLIFLFKKKLPWNLDVHNFNNDKYNELIKIKKTNANGNLFIDIPEELKQYINYTKNLKFEQDPDYEYLKSLLYQILVRKNIDIKNIFFSWINPKNKKLIGSPGNKNNKKSNFRKRILKNILEGKSRNNSLSKDNTISNINNSQNIKKCNSHRDIHNSKIKIIKLNNLRNQNNVTNIKIENDFAKTIYNIQNNNEFHKPRRNIIKLNKKKLTQLDFNHNNVITLNNETQNYPINFIKKNMTIKNLERIKIIRKPIILEKDPSFNRNEIINNLQNNTIDYTEEKNIFEKKINQKRRNILKFNKALKIRSFNRINEDIYHELNKANSNSTKSNKLNYNINITYNNYGGNNVLDNNENLNYKQTPTNFEVMIINNYNNINRDQFKKY